jgi:iron complex outermembrane receptor protein/outer membrane receptor for ferrienterochelin and colicins
MNWVTGVNYNVDIFKDQSPYLLPLVTNYSNTTLGAFIQNTIKPSEKWIIESGIRYDITSHFGNFPLPRLSVLYKINNDISTRVNGGFGYKTPTVLSYVDLETDLSKTTLINKLNAELSRGFNADINYKKRFSNGLDVTLNQSFFYTIITNPIYNSATSISAISLKNASQALVSKGFQSYCRFQMDDFEWYLGYVFTDIKKEYDQQNSQLQVTPKHNFSTTLFYESSEKWRFGIESSLIASQVDEIYQPVKNYLLAAAMTQYKIKQFTIVLNVENLFDFKQSDYGKIYSGTIQNPTFQKLWAPIDGRVFNVSLKYML